MKNVKNPHTTCEKLYNLVHNLTGQLKDLIAQKIYDQRGGLLLCFVISVCKFSISKFVQAVSVHLLFLAVIRFEYPRMPSCKVSVVIVAVSITKSIYRIKL